MMDAFIRNKKGKVDPKGIVMIIIAFFVFAVTFMIAMTQIDAATHTKWNAAVWTMFDTVLPILGIVGAIIGFLAYVKGGKGEAKSPVLWIPKIIDKLKNSKKGGLSVADVVYLSIGLLVAALVFPIAMNNGVFGNTAVLTWVASPVYTLFTIVVPIIVIIAVGMVFISHISGGGKHK